MKWLSKLFGSKTEEPAKEQVSMNIAELSSLIDGKIRSKMELFMPELESFYSQIQAVADRLQEKVSALGKAAPPERVDFQLLKVASSHRSESISRLNLMLKTVKRQISVNFDSFIEFHNSCVSALDSADAKLVRNFAVFEEVFSQESSSMMSEYKSFYRLLRDIGIDLKEKKLAIDPLSEIKHNIVTLENMMKDLDENDTMMRNLDSELTTLRELDDALKNKIGTLIAGEEWGKFETMFKDMELLDAEIKETEGRIGQTILSVERALRNYIRLYPSSKKFIEFYLKEPLDASLSDENQAKINAVICSIEIAMLEGKITIGGKREERILDGVRAIKNGLLESLVKRYRTLQNKKYELMGGIEKSDIKNVKVSLESELNEINVRMNDMGDKLQKFIKNKNALPDEINRTKISLEKLIQDSLNQSISIMIV